MKRGSCCHWISITSTIIDAFAVLCAHGIHSGQLIFRVSLRSQRRFAVAHFACTRMQKKPTNAFRQYSEKASRVALLHPSRE